MFDHLKLQLAGFLDSLDSSATPKPKTVKLEQLEQLDSRLVPSAAQNPVISFWQDGVYGVNQFGTPDKLTVGVSLLDANGGATPERELYREDIAGYPFTSGSEFPLSLSLATRPDGAPLVVGNRVFLYGSAGGQNGFGTPGSSFFQAPRDERSRLVSVDLGGGKAVVLSEAPRQITGLGQTDNGQLMVQWSDTVYGTNAYGPESVTSGVSRFDVAGGGEMMMFSQTLDKADFSGFYSGYSGLGHRAVVGPDGRSILPGRLVVYKNSFGQVGFSGTPAKDDGTNLRVIEQTTGKQLTEVNSTRQVNQLTTTLDNGLLVSFTDGTYTDPAAGTNPYFSSGTSSFTYGLSRIDLTDGKETVLDQGTKDTYDSYQIGFGGGSFGSNPYAGGFGSASAGAPIVVAGKQVVVATQFGQAAFGSTAAKEDRTRVLVLNGSNAPTTALDRPWYANAVTKAADGGLLLGFTDYRFDLPQVNGVTPRFSGLVRVDPATGAETSLFAEAVDSSTNPYASGPRFESGIGGAPLLAGGSYVVIDSVGGSPQVPASTNPYFPQAGQAARDDRSRILLVAPGGGVRELQVANREVRDIGVTADGSGLIVSWYDGKYGTNPYGPESADRGVSRIDVATGTETVVYQEAVPNLPVTASSTNPYGSSFGSYYSSLGLETTPDGTIAQFGDRFLATDNKFGFAGSTNPYSSSQTGQADEGTVFSLGTGSKTTVAGGSRTFQLFAQPLADVAAATSGRERAAVIGTPQFAAGGNGKVTLFNPDRSVRASFTAFDGYTGAVRTATADFSGDGVPDVALGTGPGAASRVRILDSATGRELFAINPFEAAFTGGVYVATGDLDGDGVPDLVISPDEGGGPRIRLFSGGKGFTEGADFFGIEDVNFRGGARVAIGDVTGDGVPDLIVAAGFGGGPRVSVYDGTSLSGRAFTKRVMDFFVFEEGLRNGAYVTAGDVTGDGKLDLIVGGGPSGGPRVSVFDGTNLRKNDTTTRSADFFAGDPNDRTGVKLAVKDLNGDQFGDLVTIPGKGGTATAYYGKAAAIGSEAGFALDLGEFGGAWVG